MRADLRSPHDTARMFPVAGYLLTTMHLQTTIFDLIPNPQLERVADRISGAVFSFCFEIGIDATFNLTQLEAFVRRYMIDRKKVPPTPGSASRILRDLARKGAVWYEVIDRAASSYKLTKLDARNL